MVLKRFLLSLSLVLVLPAISLHAGNGNGKPAKDMGERKRVLSRKQKKYTEIEEEKQARYRRDREALIYYLEKGGMNLRRK